MTCNSIFYFCYMFGIPRCPSAHVGPPAADRPASSMAYDHMPIQLRHAMAQVPKWTLTRESHMLFTETCAAKRNKKMHNVKEIFDAMAHVGLDRYWQTFGICKDEKQWKARCQGEKSPSKPPKRPKASEI